MKTLLSVLVLIIVVLAVVSLCPCSSFAEVKTDVNGAVFLQFVGSRDVATNFHLMGAELNVRSQVSTEDRDILFVGIQVPVATAMQGFGRGMHFANAYGIIPIGLGLPSIKFGQFVIPFGNLAVYETHEQIVQTLYSKSLGIRIDGGVSVSGILGPLDYAFSLTNGEGSKYLEALTTVINGMQGMQNDAGMPGEDNDFVFASRIAHKASMDFADIEIGVSILRGILPVFALGEDPISKMNASPMGYELKYRTAVDGQIDVSGLIARAEIVAGKDGSLFANEYNAGYYVELRYPIVYGLEVLAKNDMWFSNVLNPVDRTENYGFGFNYKPKEFSSYEIQSLFDYNRTLMGNEIKLKRSVILMLVGRF